MYAAVYAVPLRLVGRLSVDFLLVIIELFVGCYESIDWNSAALKGMREFGKTFQTEGSVPHQPIFVRKIEEYPFHILNNMDRR